MAIIEKEIIAYDLMREELEADHKGEWVLVHDQQLIGTYETFQEAAAVATGRFGRGPYLIKGNWRRPDPAPVSTRHIRNPMIAQI